MMYGLSFIGVMIAIVAFTAMRTHLEGLSTEEKNKFYIGTVYIICATALVLFLFINALLSA